MKIVEHILNKKHSGVVIGHYGELVFLYSDGTWEKIFEYHWTDPCNTKPFRTKGLTGKTREEAIEHVKKYYYEKHIEGHFTI